MNPCVPVDFPTVNAALKSVAMPVRDVKANGKKRIEIQEDVRVLLKPGRHETPETIRIQTSRRLVRVTLECVQLPPTIFKRPIVHAYEMEEEYDRPMLVSGMQRRNEPLIRIVRGELAVKNVALDHHCYGTDIWNGNTAVHLRASGDVDGNNGSAAVPRATAKFEHCEITSRSGRGIVAVEGSLLQLVDCYVHDCAATGVYIGGVATRASLTNCDVLENGTGNQMGGVARGHSGLYIEQGAVDVDGCSISKNSAAGISVVSRAHSSLTMQNSEIILNGFGPMELPTEVSEQIVVDASNRLAVIGQTTPRSTVLVASEAREARLDEMY